MEAILIQIAEQVGKRIVYHGEPCAVILYPSGSVSVIARSDPYYSQAPRCQGYLGVYAPGVKVAWLVADISAQMLAGIPLPQLEAKKSRVGAWARRQVLKSPLSAYYWSHRLKVSEQEINRVRGRYAA